LQAHRTIQKGVAEGHIFKYSAYRDTIYVFHEKRIDCLDLEDHKVLRGAISGVDIDARGRLEMTDKYII
jgi:hypothetical protein